MECRLPDGGVSEELTVSLEELDYPATTPSSESVDLEIPEPILVARTTPQIIRPSTSRDTYQDSTISTSRVSTPTGILHTPVDSLPKRNWRQDVHKRQESFFVTTDRHFTCARSHFRKTADSLPVRMLLMFEKLRAHQTQRPKLCWRRLT